MIENNEHFEIWMTILYILTIFFEITWNNLRFDSCDHRLCLHLYTCICLCISVYIINTLSLERLEIPSIVRPSLVMQKVKIYRTKDHFSHQICYERI